MRLSRAIAISEIADELEYRLPTKWVPVIWAGAAKLARRIKDFEDELAATELNLPVEVTLDGWSDEEIRSWFEIQDMPPEWFIPTHSSEEDEDQEGRVEDAEKKLQIAQHGQEILQALFSRFVSSLDADGLE